MSIKLNSDLGESFGSWEIGRDASVMQYIDQANIACGFHAGDPQWMIKTLKLAAQHGVEVGAHPGYPDLAGFGRRSMVCSSEEIVGLMHYQMAALDGMAKSQGLEMTYVKPHGALYNDMMAQTHLRRDIMQAVSSFYRPITLVLQATPTAEEHRKEAAEFGINVVFEAFVDRCYADDGKLLSRSKVGAVLDKEGMLRQVHQLIQEGTITTISGHILQLEVDTLCVHGDNDTGVGAIAAIRELMSHEH